MTGLRPYLLVIPISIALIVVGIVLCTQTLSFRGYQIGYVTLMLGAILQIIMGQLDPKSNWLQALRLFVIGAGIFLGIVFLSIYLVPYLYKLL